MTFFSQLEHKFEKVAEGEDIATEPFLLAYNSLLPFFDILGRIKFKLAKSDISGHIQRVQKKFNSAPEQYHSLQSIVDSEIAEGTNKARRSCSMSILWLQRTLEFIYIFMETVLSGNEDCVKCASKAYNESLRRFHGWFIRSIFYLLIRATPHVSEFLVALKNGEATVTDEQLFEQMRAAMINGKTIIEEIDRFFTVKGAHSNEIANSIEFQ